MGILAHHGDALRKSPLRRDNEKKMERKPSETFFEAPEALPARGSIPSVHALDPAIAAARKELANEAEHATLIHAGEPTSSPPVPADVSPQPHPSHQIQPICLACLVSSHGSSLML